MKGMRWICDEINLAELIVISRSASVVGVEPLYALVTYETLD